MLVSATRELFFHKNVYSYVFFPHISVAWSLHAACDRGGVEGSVCQQGLPNQPGGHRQSSKSIKTCWHFIFRACFAGVQGLKTPAIHPSSRSLRGGGWGGGRGGAGAAAFADASSLLQVRYENLI